MDEEPVEKLVVHGKTTNEFKTDLIKRGYDIFCPGCDNHFSLATFTHRTTCPRCGYIWRVGINGHPIS